MPALVPQIILDQKSQRDWLIVADHAGCLQAVFGDGSVHALDFGYETDLARVWTSSFLLHTYFGKPDSGPHFDEPRGTKLDPLGDVA